MIMDNVLAPLIKAGDQLFAFLVICVNPFD